MFTGNKEKTVATKPVNNLPNIDVSKPLTPEEQALVMQNNGGNTNWGQSHPDSISDYYPGKYYPGIFEELEEKNGHIKSYVGDCKSNPAKGIVANLGKDVYYVQKHLNRLGILSDKDYAKEKPVTGKEISKTTIPKSRYECRSN